MPVQLPRAPPADSVMTRLWSHRARLHPQLYQTPARIISTSSVLKVASWSQTLPSSSSSSSLFPGPGKLSPRSPKPQLLLGASSTVSQVCKLQETHVLLRLILLLLLAQPVVSKPKPWSNMQPNHVVFRSQICQSVSRTNLHKMMSSYFDKSRMATDLASAKRNFASPFGEQGNIGYQGDEPYVGLAVQNADVVERTTDWSPDDEEWQDEREDVDTENRILEEIDDNDIVDRQTLTSRKKVTNRRLPNKPGKISGRKNYLKNKKHQSEGQRLTTLSDSYSYMKRRRRRSRDDAEVSSQSHYPDGDIASVDDDLEENVNFDEYELEEEETDIDPKDKKSADTIQLRLFLRGKDKKTRKLLKKKLRQKAKNLTKPPPWECKFTQVNKHMREGIFPDIVLDGRCETDKCFYRLYSCEPIKYVMKLLQRDPNECNPLPSLSNETEYEERWDLIQYHVTVGCKCSSPNSKNSKSKPRRRD